MVLMISRSKENVIQSFLCLFIETRRKTSASREGSVK